MEETNKTFNKGDFIKYTVYNGSTVNKVTFGIFEGIDLAPEFQYTKKYSLAAYYDSWKYSSNINNGAGWGYAPFLEIAMDDKPCEKTIDTLKEDSWWKLCTQEEKQNAIAILAAYGYEWNEELLAIVDTNTGEIVHKIIVPKLEYNGEIIKPICKEFKNKLRSSLVKKTNVAAATPCYRGNPYAHSCDPYYDDENWD